MPGAQHRPAVEVPHGHGRHLGEDPPLQPLFRGHLITEECVHRSPQRRLCCRMPLGDHRRQTIEEEVTRSRSLRWRWGRAPLREQAGQAGLDLVRADQLLEPPGVGADRVRAGQCQAIEHLLGRSHRLGRERRDAPRELGHERVQLGVGQRPVDPAVPFGLVGAEVGRTQDHLHGLAPPQQPRQVLQAARARGRAGTDLDLPQDGVLPSGEPHVARQRQFAAGAAGPAAELRDRHDRQLAKFVPQHAQRRVVRPAPGDRRRRSRVRAHGQGPVPARPAEGRIRGARRARSTSAARLFRRPAAG